MRRWVWNAVTAPGKRPQACRGQLPCTRDHGNTWGSSSFATLCGRPAALGCLVTTHRSGFGSPKLSRRRPAPNRVHLNLTSSTREDQADTVGTTRGLGARDVDVGQLPEGGHVVLADRDDKGLCVIEPATTSSPAAASSARSRVFARNADRQFVSRSVQILQARRTPEHLERP
jgi:hypothetical protein